MNLLTRIARHDPSPLSWEREPQDWGIDPSGALRVEAPAGADAFRDPAGAHVVDTAPFLWLPVEGDFVARALVRPTFANTYDSGCLMVRGGPERWAKVCYERTDFGTEAVVSVVTYDTSDDANGVDLAAPEIWLQIARAGDCFGLHYALPTGDAAPDGGWRMVRYFRLEVPRRVRVGLLAQSPRGPGTTIMFRHLAIEGRTAANLRAGA